MPKCLNAQMPKFIKNELKSDSESNSDSHLDDQELILFRMKRFCLWLWFRFRSWVKI